LQEFKTIFKQIEQKHSKDLKDGRDRERERKREGERE
jgi:hypothetical protein